MSIRTLTPIPLKAISRVEPDGRASVEIYRRFFLAGILVVLTAGCSLGALALLGISRQGTYLANGWTPFARAHANSQLYGWVGLFLMGFALQQHPPRISKAQLYNRLAWASLALIVCGLVLRFFAEPLVKANPSVWMPLGVGSAVLEFVAVLLFVVNTSLTRYKTGQGLSWQSKFVFASLGWWLAVAAAEPFFFAFSHQREAVASVAFVAKWFPPYREAQFLGFVAMMIFGVALVKMNSCFGARAADPRAGNTGFIIWNIGLGARMIGWVMFADSGFRSGANTHYLLGGVLIAAAAGMLVNALGIFEPLRESLKAHKFVKGAFIWLLISGALLILEPLHLSVTHQEFSHAYIGALRHALTVGFISQMILGVGMHVIGRMNDLAESRMPSLWTAFWLVNIGNALRVCLEIATDYTPHAFSFMGISGFLELFGLLLWAIAIVPPMLPSLRFAEARS